MPYINYPLELGDPDRDLRECEDLEPKGKETVTTTSMMQPTDAPRLHKLEKATLKTIKRQIYKQKRKMLKSGSKRLPRMRKLFRPGQRFHIF